MRPNDRDRKSAYRGEIGLRAHFIATTAGDLREQLKTCGDDSLHTTASWRLLSVVSLVDAGVRDMVAYTPPGLDAAQRQRLTDARAALDAAERSLRDFCTAERERIRSESPGKYRG